MSFEGYYQKLCKKGHYLEEDVYLDESIFCTICGEKFIWLNLVDLTNGLYDDEGNRIDNSIELKIKEQRKCEHCNSILETRFFIPNDKQNIKSKKS